MLAQVDWWIGPHTDFKVTFFFRSQMWPIAAASLGRIQIYETSSVTFAPAFILVCTVAAGGIFGLVSPIMDDNVVLLWRLKNAFARGDRRRYIGHSYIIQPGQCCQVI